MITRIDTRELTVVLNDFDLVREINETDQYTKVGKSQYMAPEIGLGEFGISVYGAKVDIWSLGVVLLEMMLVPELTLRDIQNNDNEFPRAHRDILRKMKYSEELIDLVLSMLIKNPDNRVSAAEICEKYVPDYRREENQDRVFSNIFANINSHPRSESEYATHIITKTPLVGTSTVYDKLVFSTNENIVSYQYVGELGQGRHLVRKYKQENGSYVAIKFIHITKNQTKRPKEECFLIMDTVDVLHQMPLNSIAETHNAYYHEENEYNHVVYQVMKCYEHGSLHSYMTGTPSPIPQRLLLWIMYQLCTALYMFHSHSPPLIHRDLKPANIVITDMVGNLPVGVAVTDFDSARILEHSYASTLVGTVGYMSPEVAANFDENNKDKNKLTSRYGRKCDIWSLGVVLIELMLGEFQHRKTHGITKESQMNKVIEDPSIFVKPSQPGPWRVSRYSPLEPVLPSPGCRLRAPISTIPFKKKRRSIAHDPTLKHQSQIITRPTHQK
jgi:serine/threonine protein kinase